MSIGARRKISVRERRDAAIQEIYCFSPAQIQRASPPEIRNVTPYSSLHAGDSPAPEPNYDAMPPDVHSQVQL